MPRRAWFVCCRGVAWDGRPDKFCAIRLAYAANEPQISSESEAIRLVQEHRMTGMLTALPGRALVDWTAKEGA